MESTRGGREKQGGGLLLIYKSSLDAHPWVPTVEPSKAYVSQERQWLLIQGHGGKKVAVLSCYLACQHTDSDQFITWNRDLYSLMTEECQILKSQHYQVVALGDFNAKIGQVPGLEGNQPDRNRIAPLFLEFISQVGLFILNTLPTTQGVFTRFMTGVSGSLY